MRLVKAELRRLVKRRLTRYLLLLVVLGIAAILVSFSVASQRVGAAERAAAEAVAEEQYRRAVTEHEQGVQRCEAAKARGEATEEFLGPDCGRGMPPQREWFDASWSLPYEFNFHDDFGHVIIVLAGILTLYALVLGASFVGAEWSSGGVMNLLLWRPRRLRVLGAKLGVLLGGLLVVGVVLGALWTVGFWLIGTHEGVPGPMTPGAWRSFALTGARGLGLVLAAGAVGFGLASLGRHTATALGAAVGLMVVSEIGVKLALMVAGASFPDRYVLSTYARAWLTKTVRLMDSTSCEYAQGTCNPATDIVTWQQSGALFAIGTVLAVGAAFWTMRRRDIT